MLSTKTTTLTQNFAIEQLSQKFLSIQEYTQLYTFLYYCYIIKYTLSSLDS